jgi:hypothetical protein
VSTIRVTLRDDRIEKMRLIEVMRLKEPLSVSKALCVKIERFEALRDE